MSFDVGDFAVHKTVPDIIWRVTELVGGEENTWGLYMVRVEHVHGPIPTNEDARAIFLATENGEDAVLIDKLEDPNAMLLLALESQ